MMKILSHVVPAALLLGGSVVLYQGTVAAALPPVSAPSSPDAKKVSVTVVELQKQINELKTEIASLKAAKGELEESVAKQESDVKLLGSAVGLSDKRIQELDTAFKGHKHAYHYFKISTMHTKSVMQSSSTKTMATHIEKFDTNHEAVTSPPQL
jgi:hypothetical protein